MTIILIWVLLSLLAGKIAGDNGRSFFGFFILSVLLSPVVGILAALIAGKIK